MVIKGRDLLILAQDRDGWKSMQQKAFKSTFYTLSFSKIPHLPSNKYGVCYSG